MRKTILFFLLLVTAWVGAVDSSRTITFQGYLTDSNGAAVYDSRYMAFAIYASPAGTDTLVDSTAIESRLVTVYNGNYATKITLSGDALNRLNSAREAWMQIWVSNSGSGIISDSNKMSPRIQLTATPYALNVRGFVYNATQNVVLIGSSSGYASTYNFTINEQNSLLVEGRVGIGTNAPASSTRLEVYGTASANRVNISTLLTVTGNGINNSGGIVNLGGINNNNSGISNAGNFTSAGTYNGATITSTEFNGVTLLSDGTISSNAINLHNGGITNAGNITSGTYNGATITSTEFNGVTLLSNGTISSNAINLHNGGITNAGNITSGTYNGATITSTEFNGVTLLSNGQISSNAINLHSGGISNAGAISGGTGDFTYLTMEPTAGEGGEIQLMGYTEYPTNTYIDNFQNSIRFHNGTAVWAYIDEYGLNSALWNDLAEFRPIASGESKVPGKCYVVTKKGLKVSSKRAEIGTIGIYSDSYGLSLGGERKDPNKIPIAISGWVLAYVDKDYPLGTALVSGPDGVLTAATMKEKHDYPERIVGILDMQTKEYKNIKVNGRYWVKVK